MEARLALVREVARRSQRAEAQLFYSRREVALRLGAPISQVAAIFRTLEREGVLRPVRGSGTILEGLEAAPRKTTRGVVAIVSSLSRFVTEQDYRAFLRQMDQELQKRDFSSAEALFDLNESADELADRLKGCQADWVVWYAPQRLSKEVALRMHDVGVSIVGVADSGFPRIACQYEIRRQRALAQIVRQWKNLQAMTEIRVAVGPKRSAADEARIGRTLEDLDIRMEFVSLGAQTIERFVASLARDPTTGTVLSPSTAFLLAMYAPGAFSRLAKNSSLALVGGPVSVPYAAFTDATVDLVMVDWKAVAKRIVVDLTMPRRGGMEQPCVVEATARCEVLLSRYSQRL